MALDVQGTDYLKLPVGTTAQRPATPAVGMTRINSTTGAPEWYDSTSATWVQFSQQTANSPNTFGFKNRVINGDMDIDQRNSGASVTATGGVPVYPVDRFNVSISTGSCTAQRSSVVPAVATNSIIITVGTSGTPAATAQNTIQQAIEGFNTADFKWGTADAQTITLSFWVRSSLTGTFAVALQNAAFNRFYVATYAISAANTWEYKTITVPGDTSGTWNTTTDAGIRIKFDLGYGSNFNTTAGAWGAGEAYSVSGCQKLVANASATFYITGVQLEKGSVATSFDFRPYGTEFLLCQRYYQFSDVWANYQFMYGATIPANYGLKSSQFFTPMRPGVTVVVYSESGVANRFSINRGGAYTAGYIVNNEGFTMTNGTGGGVNITELTFSWRANAEI